VAADALAAHVPGHRVDAREIVARQDDVRSGDVVRDADLGRTSPTATWVSHVVWAQYSDLPTVLHRATEAEGEGEETT